MSEKEDCHSCPIHDNSSRTPSPTMQFQKTAVLNSDKLNLEEELSIKLQLVIEENKLLKDTLHLSNIALQKQFYHLTHWHDDVIKVHQTSLHHIEEFKTKKQALMDETNSLRNELITALNKNKDLQKTIDQLKAAFGTVRNAPTATPAYYPIQVTSLQNELDHEKAKNKALELRTSELEAKWNSRQEELVSTIGVMNKKLETCERSKKCLEKEVSKIAHQKRGLEKKLLSLQGPESALVCHCIDWNMDADLWTQTNRFLETSAPTLTLCAEENMASLSSQLKMEKQHLARAKELLGQHQDQLTKLITALKKPYFCRTIGSSDEIDANDVGETIDTLFQKIHSLQELLVSKDVEIKQLKSRKVALEAENDKLAISKSQVIVYRADYLTERKNRETVTIERDRLLSDIQLLKDENKQLASQLSAQGLTALTVGSSRLVRSRQERKIRTPPPNAPLSSVPIPEIMPCEPVFVCPNPDCKRKFDSVEPLQLHVHQCLQLSD